MRYFSLVPSYDEDRRQKTCVISFSDVGIFDDLTKLLLPPYLHRCSYVTALTPKVAGTITVFQRGFQISTFMLSLSLPTGVKITRVIERRMIGKIRR